jgi:acetoacetate decarboxylase
MTVTLHQSVDGRRPEDAYSFPWDAPLVPAFPIRFQDVSVFTAFYRTDAAAIDRLLPPPLERVGDVVAVQIARMGDVERVGPFNECNVMVGARLKHDKEVIEGGFSTILLITSDVGLAHGREVHGQPKKLARVSLDVRDDLLVGRVERNGLEVITTTLPYKQNNADKAALTQYFDFTLNLNYKVIANIDGTPAIRELTARRLTDIVVNGCWTGPCTVEFRPSAQVPVWRLPVIEPLDGFLWSTEFTLSGGRRIHNYLGAPSL